MSSLTDKRIFFPEEHHTLSCKQWDNMILRQVDNIIIIILQEGTSEHRLRQEDQNGERLEGQDSVRRKVMGQEEVGPGLDQWQWV